MHQQGGTQVKKILSSSKLIILVVLALALAAFALGCGEEEGFAISQVQHDPFAFAGEIVINGTVATFAQDDPSLFGVMDTDELLQCGRFDCGAWIMPTVYMGGERPPITQGDKVVLTGQFESSEMGPLFQVTSMSVGNNIMDRLP
jgi:hypothetical protein